MDCDGCLTDAGMYYSDQGDEPKKFNACYGRRFKLLNEAGIITGIVTGESVKLNSRRTQKLQLDIFEMGCKDKVEVNRDTKYVTVAKGGQGVIRGIVDSLMESGKDFGLIVSLPIY